MLFFYYIYEVFRKIKDIFLENKSKAYRNILLFRSMCLYIKPKFLEFFEAFDTVEQEVV